MDYWHYRPQTGHLRIHAGNHRRSGDQTSPGAAVVQNPQSRRRPGMEREVDKSLGDVGSQYLDPEGAAMHSRMVAAEPGQGHDIDHRWGDIPVVEDRSVDSTDQTYR